MKQGGCKHLNKTYPDINMSRLGYYWFCEDCGAYGYDKVKDRKKGHKKEKAC